MSYNFLAVKQVKVKLKVIIWKILVLLQYPMLHITFQGNHSPSPREEEF